MRTFVLNKLVRDKVFLNMQEIGEQVEYRVLNDQEFLTALVSKFREEVSEFDPNDSSAIDELADILEVVKYLINTMGLSSQKVREAQSARRKKRGGFKERIFVEKLILLDDDPWAEYYARQPDRFTEINPVK